MDLIPYCAILFSNILTVAETHRKHVPHTNPNCTVLLFLPWFNNGDMFGKKKKKKREIITNLYADLTGIVRTKQWTTAPLHLGIGVFQGNPLSVSIFNTVMHEHTGGHPFGAQESGVPPVTVLPHLQPSPGMLTTLALLVMVPHPANHC